ncbi:hypothetical protein MN116_006718 [Schistosoma mekongi]|uniref:Uncharacterized protein n=1 Tax=Schistosoma mekongi TaxID=38744 RepID=A0AAE2D3N8_SCHME|nr:hypothetical protein MN116_006718 [Schistosoma mekongi]
MYHTFRNPELLEQLWIQLYRYLPAPSMGPKLSSELSASISLSVSIDNIELLYDKNQLVCRASLTLFAEWPVTDSRVTESTLVEMVGGSVRLDVDKVWHPQLVIKGAFRHDRFHQRLELRNIYAVSNTLSKSTNPSNSLNRAQTGTASRGLPNESSVQSIRSHNRGKTLKIIPDGNGPNYAFMESMVVEVACQEPKKFHHIGAVICPIWIKQEGFMKTQPVIKWTERKCCLISNDVQRKSFYLSVTKRYDEHIDKSGPDQSLGINICFSQNGRILQGSLPPLLLVLISITLLWTNQMNAYNLHCIQLTLFILSITFWLWINEQTSDHSKLSGFLNVWCLMCSSVICLIYLFVSIHHRLFCRFLQRKHQQLDRFSTLGLNQNKTPTTGFNTEATVNDRLNGPRLMQNYGCCGNCGTCPESCTSCLAGRTSTEFISSNGTAVCYSNSSCGLSGGSGHACQGISILQSNATANNSPGPIGFTQTMGLSGNKRENYGDNYLCSGSSESGNGVNNGTFRGLRWRNSRRSNNVNLLGIDLNQSDCHVCQSHYLNDNNNSNNNANLSPPPPPPPPPTAAVVALCRHQHICNPSVLPCMNVYNFNVNNYPSSYCLTGLKTFITVCFCLMSTIYWISIFAQGTLPDTCLGVSLCQLIETNRS